MPKKKEEAREQKERCARICLCVLVRAHLSCHSGIVNTDSFQLESALFNKQTSREESGGVYKEMTRQHETSAPWNHRGRGGATNTGR